MAVHAADADAVMDVRSALRELTPRERACIVLRFYDDLTVRQIADHLGLADGTVKRYLSDASARLATLLGADVDLRDENTVLVTAPLVKGRR
jgi:RNA polymerase sigma factor (sigma-70 family)